MGTRFDDPGSHSRALFERARQVIPGGTSKANFHIHPHPFYLTEGHGCRVTDADGVERLDAINNFTALIHGHAFPPLVEAVSRQLARGTAFAASTPEEVALAELLVERVPGLERIRFGNSGTEAVMMAIKAARAYTGRDRIAKFEGAYHGYYDDVQVSYSSRPERLGPGRRPGERAVLGRRAQASRPRDAGAAVERSRRLRAAHHAPRLRAGGGPRRPPVESHGLHPARRRLPRLPSPADATARGARRLRRDHLVPGGLPRGAGAVRRRSGSDRLRQDHRRWVPGGGHRRPRRGDGGVRPGDAGAADRLRRHVQREPGQHDGGARDDAGDDTGGVRSPRRRSALGSARGSARCSGRRACPAR